MSPFKSKYGYLPKYFLLPTGSNTAVQWKDAGPWTHQTIMGHNLRLQDTSDQMGCTITRAERHVNANAITAENM